MMRNLWTRTRLRNGAPLLLLLGAGGRDDVWVEREAVLMGTRFHAYVGARDRDRAISGIEAVFGEVRRLDSLLSTWREDSDIARLNRAPPGTPVPLDRELYAMLREAARWSRATGGAFDPGIGALVDAWDLRGAGREPSPAALRAARAASGIGQFRFDDRAGTVARGHADAWFDTGGFGKGVALRHARRILRQAGVSSALLSFGGQILALGGNERGDAWRVAVAHPARRRVPVATLVVRDRSVATTAQSERYVTVHGRRFGHVLDPGTGRPVPPWGAVTVVAADPALADALSTALFVMGPERGMRWLGARSDVGALFVIDGPGGLELRRNAAMEPYLRTGAHQGAALPATLRIDHAVPAG